MLRRLKCIPAVIAATLFFFAGIALADDLPPEFTNHHTLVQVSNADQAEVQNFFDAIYEKIRIAVDPEKPPRIVLVRNNHADGFVYPNQPGFVFINVDFLLNATSVDVIAALYAHELTHFEIEQLKRRGTEAGRLLNELEAQTRGIVQRLFRVGEIDPETNQPRTALYNFETIIDHYESRAGYSATHGNMGQLALALKSIFALERYRRRFPEPVRVTGIVGAFRQRLQKAAALIPLAERKAAPETAVRTEVKAKVARLKGNPYDRLKAIHAEIKKVWDPKQGNARPPTPKQFEALKPLYKAAIEEGHTLGEGNGLDGYPGFFESMQRLPEHIFQDLHALRALFPPIPDEYAENLYESLAAQERYFEGLPHGATISYSDLLRSQHQSRSRDAWLTENLHGLHLRALTERHEEDLIAAFRKDPWNHLEAMTIAARNPAVFPVTPRLKAALDEFGSTLSPSDVDYAMESGRARRADLVYLEWDPKTLTHRFSLAARERIADRIEQDNDREARNSHLRDQGTLFAAEPENLRRRIAALGDNPDLRHLIAYLEAAALTFTPTEMSSYYGPLLAGAMARANQERLFGTAQELSEAMTLVRSAADGEQARYNQMSEGIHLVLAGEESEVKLLAALQILGQVNLNAKTAALLEPLREKVGAYLNRVGTHPEQLENLPTLLPPAIERQLGEYYVRHAPYVMSTRPPYHRPGYGPPWEAIFGAASASEIVHFLPRTPADFHNEAAYEYLDHAIRRMTALVNRGEATPKEILGFTTTANRFLNGSTPALEQFMVAVENRFNFQGAEWSLQLVKAVRPVAFSTPAHYLQFVSRQLGLALRGSLGGDRRSATLSWLRKELQENLLPHIDPGMQQQVLNSLAEQSHATPPERKSFQLDGSAYEESVAKAAVHLNELLDVFEGLETNEKLALMEWLRGQRKDLTPHFLKAIGDYFRQQKRFVPTESLERYVRSRFDALPPLVRGTFFQVALDGPNGFLKVEGWREYFETHLFANLPPEVRSIVQELFAAGLEALPPTLRNLAFSLAYSESGSVGSPEQALRLFFSRMGPLMKKLGQNLAFDPHLPASYRAELRKLWDQNDPPSWWHMYELVERQHGRIWEHGYKVVAIRNAGSTEIMLEIEGPDGKREIISVQREALLIGNETDQRDLEKYVGALVKKRGGQRKYGFLQVLVEDSARTMHQEADPAHKRRMNEAMRQAYQRAAVQLGGRLHDEHAELDGWKFKNVTYHDRPLGAGHTLTTVSIAPGVPFKDIEKSHPVLYGELSRTLLRLENKAQADPSAPIDKDRMPGQVFVDVATRTVTLLDPGQSSHIRPEVRTARDPFIGAALAANVEGIGQSLRPLGISLGLWARAKLAVHLAGVDHEVRPLQTLQWLRSQGHVGKKAEETYWDLVHVVRAKVRLAQWGEDIGYSPVRAEWKELARGQTTSASVLIEVCRRVSAAVGWE